MPRHINHVRDRLSRAEQEIAELRALRHDVARLLAFVDATKWVARTALWFGCSIGAQLVSGGFGQFLSGLAKLLGRGLV